MNVPDSLTNAHQQRILLPSSPAVLEVHEGSFGPAVEDEGNEHVLSCMLMFTMFLHNLLDLYFQLLILINAISTDDSVCSRR